MKKLGLFVMPLMAVSLLASCGGNSPKSTYTIDFQGENCSSNLDLSKQYNVGDQVNFDIVIPDETKYKLPEKINVSGVSKFEYSNQTGTVSFTVESKDIGVVAKADAIEPVIQHTVTFVLNGATSESIEPVKVKEGSPFPSDKIPTNPTNPGHAFEGWSDKENTKSIVDLTKATINSDLILYAWWGDAQLVNIIFDANGGYFDDDTSVTSKTVPTTYGQVPVPPTPTKKVGGLTLSFKGWDKTLEAATSETTYIAQWDNTYTITITGDNVDEQTVTFIKDDFNTAINVTINVDAGYVLTNKITIIKGTTSNEDIAVARFIDSKTLEIMPKQNTDFVIKVETERQEYFNVTTTGNNISYYKDESRSLPLESIKAKRNEDFVFYMVAKGETSENSEGYVPPTSLSVKIGGVQQDKSYTIESVEGEYKNIMKKVTINGDYVNGDISIKGDAVEKDYYKIEPLYLCGLKKPSYEDTFYAYDDKDAIFEFIADSDDLSNDDLLTADNVFVNLDGNGWSKPGEAGSDSDVTFEHDNDKYCLHIKSNKLLEDEINTIYVVARAKAVTTALELLEWEDISYASTSGFANGLFEVGDTKSISNDNAVYKVRIIDFNKDELKESTKEEPKYAGITFDFANTITGFSTLWNDKGGSESTNYDFIGNSNLNVCFQEGGEVYKKIPSDLMKAIKTVNKNVKIHPNDKWIEGNYYTKLFPLSYDEINKNDGAYEYYKKGGTREKGFSNYWLRSPDTSISNRAWVCNVKGSLYSALVYDYAYAVAPAFCI